jgi:GNAT superfamily N-acetyltransferase
LSVIIVRRHNARAVQKFSIAPATVDDCPQCAALLVGQLREHGVDASANQLAEMLESVVADARRGFLLLARENGRIIGVAYVATILSAEHCGLVGWLEELYVLSEHRSRGVGTALLTAILERAFAIGVVAMDLEIDSSHRRVESLYRRFGFQSLERSRWVRKLTT